MLPFHDALFADQDAMGAVPWTFFATAAGLRDLPAFQSCLKAAKLSRLDSDRQAAERIGVRSTPTLLVNGVRIEGAPPLEELDDFVSRLASGAW